MSDNAEPRNNPGSTSPNGDGGAGLGDSYVRSGFPPVSDFGSFFIGRMMTISEANERRVQEANERRKRRNRCWLIASVITGVCLLVLALAVLYVGRINSEGRGRQSA